MDDVLVNTGLAYLLSFASRAFLDSDDVVEGVDLHPAVETVARLLQADPDAGDLATLARAAHPSSSPSEPDIQGARPGASISRFRTSSDCSAFCLSTAEGTAHRQRWPPPSRLVLGSYAQFYRVFREQTGRSPSYCAPPLPTRT